MVASSQQSSSKPPGPGKRTKVKTGCRTCKLRKVKCDEARPSCQRCVSTGRVCDGYGIWGGGGNAYEQRGAGVRQGGGGTMKLYNADLRHRSLAPMGVATAEEQGYFEWFQCRTSRKLPGPFQSSFWDTLLFQASATDPAVLHAILALSCAHRTDNFLVVHHSGRTKEDRLDLREQFTLRQYSKAIRFLNDRISAKDTSASQVALTACLVFVIMEFFRGNFASGNLHLRSGLKLLREIYPLSNPLIATSSSCGPITYDILEMFAKLRVQTELLGQGGPEAILIQTISEDELPIRRFHSAGQARHWLDWLLQKILHLSQQCRRELGSQDAACYPQLLDRQCRAKAELASWIDAYESSMAGLLSRVSIVESLAYSMLGKFHTMAEIMVGTCLTPACESIFDSYTQHFVSIVTQSIEGQKTAASPLIQNIVTERDGGMSKGIADMAWIPPLYYTAVKCRVHRVRLHAIKMLYSAAHMEGIWSAKLAAIVGLEVMRIEERGLYRESDVADDFCLTEPIENLDLSLPILPESYRMHNMHLVLPDCGKGNIVLEYQQSQPDGSVRALAREYDFASQRWRNKKAVNRES